ncbi:SE1832 family protein [Peribacillus butanolivorans]|uniref:SE1832 family protein n=1 Tax=Peribacillus butanolivorans TaxID=421767 RepID=UPI0035E3290C
MEDLKADYVRIQHDLEKLEFVKGNLSPLEKQLEDIEKELSKLNKQLEDLEIEKISGGLPLLIFF